MTLAIGDFHQCGKSPFDFLVFVTNFTVYFENKQKAEAFRIKLRECLANYVRISETKSRTIAFGRKAWQQTKEQEVKARDVRLSRIYQLLRHDENGEVSGRSADEPKEVR